TASRRRRRRRCAVFLFACSLDLTDVAETRRGGAAAQGSGELRCRQGDGGGAAQEGRGQGGGGAGEAGGCGRGGAHRGGGDQGHDGDAADAVEGKAPRSQEV